MVAALALLLAAADPGAYFDKRVAPILTKRCLPCHNAELNNAGISFAEPATVSRTIVAGQPEKSRLIDVLKHEGQVQMPPGPPLPKREVEVLREWVRRGAVWGKALR